MRVEISSNERKKNFPAKPIKNKKGTKNPETCSFTVILGFRCSCMKERCSGKKEKCPRIEGSAHVLASLIYKRQKCSSFDNGEFPENIFHHKNL